MKESEWKFKPDFELFGDSFPGWFYKESSIVPSDEDGWINAPPPGQSFTHLNPPTLGVYLCISDGPLRCGIRYWDGEGWVSEWPVMYWRPIVIPMDVRENSEDKFIELHVDGYEEAFIFQKDFGNCVGKVDKEKWHN